MGITYRQGNDGRLSVQQMDDNFHYLEDQLAGLTPSNSQTPTFAQVTQEGNTTTQSFYQSISLDEENLTVNTGVFGSYGSSSNPLTNGIQYIQNGVPVVSAGFAVNELPIIRFSANIEGLQKELLFALPFQKENPSYPDPVLYTLATTDDIGTGPTGPQGATGPAGFGTTGAISFPFLPGNARTGSGDNLQFEKGSVYQKIISTQDGTESAPTVERLVICGGDSYQNGPTYSGEGGDVYLYGGKGQDGGDIKVDAGEGISSGGTVKVRGGDTGTGAGGFIEISAGQSNDGVGGNVIVNAGNGNGIGNVGGSVLITSGYGNNTGGNISLNTANGGTAGGDVTVTTEGVERMRVTHDGKIGIGTDTPTVALDVVGDIKNTGLLINTIDGLYKLGDWDGNFGSEERLIVDSPNNSAYFDNYLNNIKLGINTASPSVTLDVNGDMNITGVITSASTITLKPDSSLDTDQYIVIEPTGGVPNHIHIRAGGDIDNSSVDLIIGGEDTNLKISDTTKTVEIKTNGTSSWQFAATGITYPDNTIQTTADSRPYKVYTALLSQIGTSSVQSISTGDLTVGVTYFIDDATQVDFTNVGSPNNTAGTYFIASGTTPNSWGDGGILLYNLGAPIVTVLENTIGNIWWIYNNVGDYSCFSNSLFTIGKTTVFIGPESYGITDTSNLAHLTVYAEESFVDYVEFLLCDPIGRVDGIVNKSIEIRVYN
jgi:hypothetical protein